MNYGKVVFDQESFVTRAGADREFLQRVDASVEEFMGDYLMMQLKATVCAHNLRQNEVSYPADWWQHFKQRWFPRWVLDRWPVLEKTERIEIKALFPDLPISDDKLGQHYLYAHKETVRDELEN